MWRSVVDVLGEERAFGDVVPGAGAGDVGHRVGRLS